MIEKDRPEPLYVRLARAVGFEVRDAGRDCDGQCVSAAPEDGSFPHPRVRSEPHRHEKWEYWYMPDFGDAGDGDFVDVPGLSWEWVGPMIEKYRIDLAAFPVSGGIEWRAVAWRPFGRPEISRQERDNTLLAAVARLIVKLAAEGKLEP